MKAPEKRAWEKSAERAAAYLVWAEANEERPSVEELDSILRLMSAAPDLLAMCKLIMAEWDSDARSTQCFDSRIITGTRLAIQKAEGRA